MIASNLQDDGPVMVGVVAPGMRKKKWRGGGKDNIDIDTK